MAPPNSSCLSSVTQGQDKSKGERKERRKRREKGNLWHLTMEVL